MFPTASIEAEITLRILILAPTGLLWVIFLVRVIGLRTFSKMTAFDFVATVAVGSLLANAATASSWPAYWQSVGGMVLILISQAFLALWRQRTNIAPIILENEPRILFREGVWREEALQQSRTTKSDIWGKMREANVLDLNDVRAVILETTGDISVLHGEKLSEEILTGVSD
ncbi:uncharacterized protein DUF421 [Litorimonas taeanensis]|uniref:Uncharacterized protein DUF421 n=1 Tax=Litorimonas taeanensis TaxID=568099 RepID=A0A420WIV6_9PROT|nr:YetF domain-containing protein [Litorimonas taeanensis]RKQ70869.1 uncharacterized protein DUF421 [Litorimonas taeanensis]